VSGILKFPDFPDRRNLELEFMADRKLMTARAYQTEIRLL